MTIHTTSQAIEKIRDLFQNGRDTPTYDIRLAHDARIDRDAIRDYLGGLLGRHVVIAPNVTPAGHLVLGLDTAGRCLLRAYNVYALAPPGQRISDLECITRAAADFEASHGIEDLDAALEEVLVDFPERYPLERYPMAREIHGAVSAFVANR